MSLSITFLTLNLCGQDPSDGKNPWIHRKELCVDLLKKFRPIIFCVQAGEFLRALQKLCREFLSPHLSIKYRFSCPRSDMLRLIQPLPNGFRLALSSQLQLILLLQF